MSTEISTAVLISEGRGLALLIRHKSTASTIDVSVTDILTTSISTDTTVPEPSVVSEGSGAFCKSVSLVGGSTTTTIHIRDETHFKLVTGNTYISNVSIFDSDNTVDVIRLTAEVTYMAAPLASDSTVSITHNHESITVSASSTDPTVDYFLVTIQGYDTSSKYFTWQKMFSLDSLSEPTSINCTEDNNYPHTDGLINGQTYEIAVVAKNATGLSTDTRSRLIVANSIPNQLDSITILTGKLILNETNYTTSLATSLATSDQMIVLALVHGTEINGFPDADVIFSISQPNDITLYKFFQISDYYTISDDDVWYANSLGTSTDINGDSVPDSILKIKDGTSYAINAVVGNIVGVGNAMTTSVTAMSSGLPAKPDFKVIARAELAYDFDTTTRKSAVEIVIDDVTTADNNGSDITEYEVLRYDANNNNVVTTFLRADDILAGTPNTFRLNDLTIGIAYAITITAINANGKSIDNERIEYLDGSNTDYIIPRDFPGIPTFKSDKTGPDINTQSTIGSGKIMGTCNGIGGALGGTDVSDVTYIFELSNSPDFSDITHTSNLDAAIKTHIFSNLTNGLTYYMRVHAQNKFGEKSLKLIYRLTDDSPAKLVPAAAPTFSPALAAVFRNAIKNTHITATSFTVDLSEFEIVHNGYPITGVRVDATPNTPGATTTTTTISSANFTSLQDGPSIGLPTILEVADADKFNYTISFTPVNDVYGYSADNNNSITVTDVHFTHTDLSINDNAAGITSVISNSSAPDGTADITYSWSILDFQTNHSLSRGTKFNLTLLEKVPTLNNSTNQVAYPDEFSEVESEVVVVTYDTDVVLTTDYSHTFTGLRLGTQYQLQIDVHSNNWNDVNMSERHTVAVSQTTYVQPAAKPSITIVSANQTLSIDSNGAELGQTFSVTAGEDPIVNLTASVTSSTTKSTTNPNQPWYLEGNPPFTLYKVVTATDDTQTVTYLPSLSSTISFTPSDYLVFTENDKGATVSLNGTILGLSPQ